MSQGTHVQLLALGKYVINGSAIIIIAIIITLLQAHSSRVPYPLR